MHHPNRRKGKLKARRVLRVWRACTPYPELYTDNSPLAQALLRTRVPCSCPGCGNPRRHFGEITRQEKLADIREQEQIAEYYNAL